VIEDDDEGFDPLEAGSAVLPPTLGEGCLTRFDPDRLNENMGTDFGAACELDA
jgi:hypothetical protein